ncbi:MAG: hypothetical protein HY741_30200 [Chloroflexi bacterium]|nr:hypothetical protein [Chloroflexota bacterium]
MSTRERIQAELETLEREDLEELFALILEFIESKRQAKPESIFAQLRQIQFEGPTDFSENHDLYITGEKRVQTDSD